MRQSDGADKRLEDVLKCSLLLLGVVGLMDPVRGSAKTAVTEAHKAGVRVAMITGDQQPTAVAIAKELGILRPGVDHKRAVSECAALRSLDNQLDIDELCNRVVVWSRAQPSDKVTIVNSLMQQGHVVAMTGDGMNDAGALKKADVGLAMGIAGSDITKQAADIVLLDDRFATIIDAIDEGRRIFANIQRMTMYLLCVNIYEVLVLIAAMSIGWILPVEDEQLFYANLITHEFYPWCMVAEAAFRINMRRPPCSKKEPLIPPLMRNLLMGSVFLSYTGVLLLTQYTGSIMYLGTPTEQYISGTTFLNEFFDVNRHNCLYANTLHEDEGTIDIHRDGQPIICRVSKTGTVLYEYGHGSKEDPEEIMDKFSRVQGSWNGEFSLEKSFLKPSTLSESLTTHQQFDELRKAMKQPSSSWSTDVLARCSDVQKKCHAEAKGFEELALDDTLCWTYNDDCKTPVWSNIKEGPKVNAHAKQSSVLSSLVVHLRRLGLGRASAAQSFLRGHRRLEEEDAEDDAEEVKLLKPTLYGQYNINAWGARQMRTMFLMTMLLSETLLLLGFSKFDFALPELFSNMVFPLAWIPMFFVFLLYVYLPPSVWDLEYCPPSFVSILLAIGFAGLFYILLEVAKLFYRRLFMKNLELEEVTASLLADGALPAFTHPEDAMRRVPELWQAKLRSRS